MTERNLPLYLWITGWLLSFLFLNACIASGVAVAAVIIFTVVIIKFRVVYDRLTSLTCTTGGYSTSPNVTTGSACLDMETGKNDRRTKFL